MSENKRYLILVPRIILMDQIKTEIIKHKPEFTNKIQTIGDSCNYYDETKDITICVYNSVSIIEKYCDSLNQIFVDEAHHINMPKIYETESNLEDYELERNLEDDDTEDEIKNTTGYNKIIKSLIKYNNNVYLSATIDEHQGFEYYKKDIRDMINDKYLCDYNIIVPIFSDDPSDKNICEYLINNYINIIVYCNSQKEGKKINELLNTLEKGCSEYIDCKTRKEKRDKIINKYKNNKIKFLVNVRILVEGFDAPITKGVYFIHLPSSKTTIIQIIGRALRLHPLKTIANIILPFSSDGDEVNINKFLKILASNDSKIKQAYESKKDDSYIFINKIKDKVDETNDELVEFRYNMIYDSMGILKNSNDIWITNLEWVKKYIDENKKRPSEHDKNKEVKKHGAWIRRQVDNYKKQIMSNETITKLWEEFINDNKYKDYLLSNEEVWKSNLERVKKYINENNKKPSEDDKDKDVKTHGNWIKKQNFNYRNKNKIMSNETIRHLWKDFISEYKDHFKCKEYFLSNKEKWITILEWVKKYIDENKKIPTFKNKDEIKYAEWLTLQVRNYKNKNKIMSNEIIRHLWENFISEYKDHFKCKEYFLSNKEYFLSNKEKWITILEWVKNYIDENKKRPTKKNKDEKKYAVWLSLQVQNYKNKNKIMSNETIRHLWENFISEYKDHFNCKQYFVSNKEKWITILEWVKNYIDENKKRPTRKNKDEIKYAMWLTLQVHNYKNKNKIMSNETIRKLWEDFISKYKDYFK
jgi:superfamily II DNA/RNA helicase